MLRVLDIMRAILVYIDWKLKEEIS